MKPLILKPILFVYCTLFAACSKPSNDAAPVVIDAGVTIAATDASAGATAVVTWRGTYSATGATLSVPDGGEWAGTKWRGDDAGSEAMGDGTLTITITNGIVAGTIDGALGAAIIDGTADKNHFSARIDRKDKADNGLVGVLDGTVNGAEASGEMHLSSLVNAHLLRRATFQLKQGN